MLKVISSLAVFVLVIVSLFLIFNRQKFMNNLPLSQYPKPTGPIVFFGNSITAGVGANPGEDFPTLIGQKLNVPIINAGVAGDTTETALARIEQDVISKNLPIVIVELGGNDFLNKVDFATTKQNFEKIMQRLKTTDAKIIIVSIRTTPLQDKYESYLEELSKKYEAVFVPNILEGVISDPNLKSDEIHPNAKGYQIIADRLIKVLKPLL